MGILKTIKENKIGTAIGAVVGIYSVTTLVVKQFKLTNKKHIIAAMIVCTVASAIGGSQIQQAIKKK